MVRIIGAGLAGCEAAWQAAERGLDVELYEMRPHVRGPAHKTDRFAELVCSNSLRGASLENAVGLLKEELFRLDSLIISSARQAAVPAGGALAVDRERFAELVEQRLTVHPRVRIRREEVRTIDPRVATIVACGPLPAQPLADAIDALLEHAAPRPAGRPRLHYYDAASPIVAADSLDLTQLYAKSRYDKGDGADYLNIALDRERYAAFVRDLRELPKHEPKGFEADSAAGKIPYFEGCLPIEEMASRGEDALRYGPLKPVGLRDPRTGTTPHAVVQLRKENAAGTAYNLVGFQTRLTWPAQKEAFGKLPGLAQAEWLRLGVMHRNSFLDAPRLLLPDLRLRGRERTWFAGQITGAEGYVEAAACGTIAALSAARVLTGLEPLDVPADTALGAVVAHLQNAQTSDFQPANVTWAYFSELPGPRVRDKRERRRLLAERALRRVDRWREELALRVERAS
ncbi:MAG: methylenetetrahydrofolate--tRNA-(uracil(54)-C(5))-methyltransferase (FADH(2)-oxidizing) TrmFO [Candidatus Eremiobacteraeota bacterium]|nr:methylenetetrahydrofolate--tRNA-(uracil(54)-C(5))-methyltransferase (FADH(2)-oxidizing) TrmFO [Candidatus Eremiobacteraeota bacterium]MBC5802513.1 methylenetetrahydrofolate--tRNA-(uracil(54)-C(5))-methyltransferase (FADH(2)-oxidizing) TrmFO [Candidatus Eremiobacteraeota bacterium]MBC5820534.1 methylenetetrahydrofolate--tRNA-(uracil(54)-C(5))-methyltransferase (FADH(2)-oxidizing) TrmFO [Candidatus Eremiobacteraeota bacterium]